VKRRRKRVSALLQGVGEEEDSHGEGENEEDKKGLGEKEKSCCFKFSPFCAVWKCSAHVGVARWEGIRFVCVQCGALLLEALVVRLMLTLWEFTVSANDAFRCFWLFLRSCFLTSRLFASFSQLLLGLNFWSFAIFSIIRSCLWFLPFWCVLFCLVVFQMFAFVHLFIFGTTHVLDFVRCVCVCSVVVV
jgi:hypothetical protein